MKYIQYSAIIIGVLILVGIGGLILRGGDFSKTISIKNEKPAPSVPIEEVREVKEENLSLNPFTGITCEGGIARPFAVMLAADVIARPLYSIVQADIVVEMPVLTNGITRYMAIFGCEHPQEIGSIRSARHDFIPFAKSFDAIFVHWGGSYLALDALKSKELDNIDALPNPYEAFYRRSDKIMPHNGFTSFERLYESAQKLGYRMEGKGRKYPHIKEEVVLNTDQNIALGYPFPHNVDFSYRYATNSYARLRGGEKEIDIATNTQVEVKNVIVMEAVSRQVNADYNDVDIEGEGRVSVYRNGEVKKGIWKREEGSYIFLDGLGKEIGLVEGKIWISIIQPDQKMELTLH